MNKKLNKFFRLVLISTIFTLSTTTIISCEDNSGTGNSSNCDPNCNSVQCSGKTQSGDRCKNQTKNCCGYCYLHK